MSKQKLGSLASLALVVVLAGAAAAVEVDSKAEKITLTGRVQALWTHSSQEGQISNEFLMRRVRAAVKVKVNGWVSGIAEPDFAEGKVDLKDAYMKLEPNDYFGVILGQTKRRFDLFELTSSTQMLIIERDGRIGRTKVPSLSYLTEDLGYADRDLGIFVFVHDEDERLAFEAAVTNGSGANAKTPLGEKAYQARLSAQPHADHDLALHAGLSVRPHLKGGAAGRDSSDVKYASAFEGSLEWGSFKKGPHVQAGVVLGANHKKYIAAQDKTPTFLAFQGIATYKHAFENNRWAEAIEPLVRVSYADPDTDVDKDGGIVVTPGVNLFLAHRNRLAINADIFLPQADDAPATAVEEDAVLVGLKAAAWLYW